MPVTTNTHHILTKDEFRCVINALDLLELFVTEGVWDKRIEKDLKGAFSPAAIEATRAKFI
jgi:hypothetical protein